MILLVNRSGQMCNQIIEFMHPYAAALEYGHTVLQLYPRDYARYFICEADPAVRFRHCDAKSLVFLRRLISGVKIRILHRKPTLKPSSPARLKQRVEAGKSVIWKDCLYRDFDALSCHRDEVERYFRFRNEICAYGESVMNGISPSPDTAIVGVHLRRKDYRVYADGKLFFEDDTVIRWLRMLLSERPCLFLMFSDEPVTESAYEGLPVRFMHGNAGEDLCVMSRCPYLMGPLSTFSWTAHFLGHNRLCVLTDRQQCISFEDFQSDVLGVV